MSETLAINEQTVSLRGKYDFSEYQSVSNAAAPGDLIRATPASREVLVTDIIIYNAAGVAAVITFYDETSKIYSILSVGAGETAVLTLKASIVYGTHSIYARTDQAVNAEITVAGRELIQGT